MMDRFFDCLNVTRYMNHSKKPELEPFKSVDGWRFDVSILILTMIPKLEQLFGCKKTKNSKCKGKPIWQHTFDPKVLCWP